MIEKGMVVRSKAGHDRGGFFLVMETEGDFALLAGGKNRPLDRQKRKRKKHLAETLVRIDPGCVKTDRQLRRALAKWNGGPDSEKEESDLGQR